MSDTRLNVVIIDDNELIRASLRLALPLELVEVVGEAGTGRSGLELCLRLKPDLIFLDVMMPDLDGLDILPRLIEGLPGAQVLMVTASNDRLTIEKSIMGGAVGYIIKPFNAGRIADAVGKAQATLRRRQSA